MATRCGYLETLSTRAHLKKGSPTILPRLRRRGGDPPCHAGFVPVMVTPARGPAPPVGAAGRKKGPLFPSSRPVLHVMAQVVSVPVADQTVGNRHRM